MKIDMPEIWKPVTTYEGLYEVSNKGFVRSIKTQKIIIPRKPRGYLQVGLSKNGIRKGFYIHRLVALAFIENKNKYKEINHIDENKCNNDVSNLEWCSRKYNCNYGTKTQRAKNKICHKVFQLSKDNEIVNYFNSIEDAHLFTGVNRGHISSCTNNKRKTAGGYKWVLFNNYKRYCV